MWPAWLWGSVLPGIYFHCGKMLQSTVLDQSCSVTHHSILPALLGLSTPQVLLGLPLLWCDNTAGPCPCQLMGSGHDGSVKTHRGCVILAWGTWTVFAD